MKRPRKGSKARVRLGRLGQEREEIVAAIQRAYDIDRLDCDLPEVRLPPTRPPSATPTKSKHSKHRKGD